MTEERTRFISTIIVIAALLVRTGFRLWNPQSSTQSLPFLLPYIELLIFLSIAMLIFINKKNLKKFHVDRLSLILFLLFGSVLRTINPSVPTSIVVEIVFWLVSIFLFIFLFRLSQNREYGKGPGSLWVILGTGLGILFGGILSITPYLSMLNNNNQFPQQTFSFFFFLNQFIHEMGHAAILEEPIYRGFLWGLLRDHGWKDKFILIFQTVLFWAAHINYFSNPYTFWLVVPLSGLLLGTLAWKSRSIAVSMVSHSTINTFRYVAFTVLSYFFGK